MSYDPVPNSARLAAPQRLAPDAALFLDFDGTLAEIAPTPDAVSLPPGMLDQLAATVDRLQGRVALLSGRPIAVLAALVPLEGLAMAGVHGLELRRADGRLEVPSPHPGLQAARVALNGITEREPRLLIEDKGLSIGLHYRDAPWLGAHAAQLVSRLAHCHGLEVQTGKMVLELRTPGADKGDALTALMADAPFAGHRPIFVGDDDTNEAAFRAAVAHGGHGIRVGGPGAETAASYRLADVHAVFRWLGGR